MTTLSQARVSGAASLRRKGRQRDAAVVRRALTRLAPCIVSELMAACDLDEYAVKSMLEYLKANGEAQIAGVAWDLPRWHQQRKPGQQGRARVWDLAGRPLLDRREGSQRGSRIRDDGNLAPAPSLDPIRVAQPITIGRGFNWGAGRLF